MPQVPNLEVPNLLPLVRTVRVSVGLTHLPQYVRLVDFLQDVEDWSLIMGWAVPQCEELDAMVEQCRVDLAEIEG